MVTGAYEKAKKYIEAHSSYSETNIKKAEGPCITISRETGAGADKVAEFLCNKLQSFNNNYEPKWAIFDKNLIEKVIEDHKLPSMIAESLENYKINEINSYLSELLGLQPSAWALLHKTAQTIMQLASMGNVIIIGRAANIITAKIKNSFHVRLAAPLEDRIKHIQELFNFGRNEAMEFIKKDDIQRKNYLMHAYHKNIDDPLLYHITINTHLLSYEEASEIIFHHFNSKILQHP